MINDFKRDETIDRKITNERMYNELAYSSAWLYYI